MKYFLILLTLICYGAESKSIVIAPPEGYQLFQWYEPKSELEKNALNALEVYLANNNDHTSNYFLAESKLNVANAVFEFKVKHHSEFCRNKSTMYMPWLSGTFIYNIKNKSVSFVREPQPNKAIKRDC